MPVQRLKEFLDANGVKYVEISHSPGYTAQELAAAAHVPGKEWAKTVVVKVDGRLAMAVLPASSRVILDLLRQATGAKNVELATEREFADRFPGCELGAMPPFGNLYDMDVFVEERLANDEEIAFNAGTYTEVIKLAYQDYQRLVKPKVLKFATTH
ncbi:MAG: YbaK/EbsC family protein [Gemmatimonadales bacterium]|nr:YbaK/EbsC family protein [Gemmatimonadales bacterium]